jgi:O-antigen chain-terminating methyltransferase
VSAPGGRAAPAPAAGSAPERGEPGSGPERGATASATAAERREPDRGLPAGERLRRDLDPALVESVAAVSERADLLAVPVTSHRPVLGVLTRPVLRLLRGMLVHVHHAQTVYNRRNADALEHLVEEHARLRADLEARDRRVTEAEAALARRDEELNAVRRRLRELRAPGEAPPGFDYRGFADSVRGPESVVRERQRRYVERFRDAGPVLDAGCGRGEFLELLREHGIAGEGVDRDAGMVEACRARGLAVEAGDLFERMAAAEDGRWGGVFSAQVVEHLAFVDLIGFLELTARKLRPGGVLVIETLNPESLFVHWRWFPMDPTHVRLVHPETLRFCLERCGFRDVAIELLPVPEPRPVEIPPLGEAGAGRGAPEAFDRATAYLNERLYAATDYAAIARRA